MDLVALPLGSLLQHNRHFLLFWISHHHPCQILCCDVFSSWSYWSCGFSFSYASWLVENFVAHLTSIEIETWNAFSSSSFSSLFLLEKGTLIPRSQDFWSVILILMLGIQNAFFLPYSCFSDFSLVADCCSYFEIWVCCLSPLPFSTPFSFHVSLQIYSEIYSPYSLIYVSPCFLIDVCLYF